MIRKPDADWGRETKVETAALAARDALRTGADTARRGAHYARGVVLFGFAALWAFAALAIGAGGGGLPTMIGVGAMAAGAAWAGQRAFAKARADAPSTDLSSGATTAFGSTTASGPFRSIAYSRPKLLRTAAGCGVLAVAGVTLIGRVAGFGAVVLAVATLALGALAVASLVKAFGDLTAVRYDAAGLTVTSLWGRRSASWSEVGEIVVRRMRTYAVFGLIPVSSLDSIVIPIRQGTLGKTIAVLPSLLDLGGGSAAAVLDDLQAARGRRAAASPGLANEGRPAPRAAKPAASDSFDPDAAIARYLAAEARRTQATQALATPAAAPSPRPFGRRAA